MKIHKVIDHTELKKELEVKHQIDNQQLKHFPKIMDLPISVLSKHLEEGTLSLINYHIKTMVIIVQLQV
jgi:hypothetical protein